MALSVVVSACDCGNPNVGGGGGGSAGGSAGGSTGVGGGNGGGGGGGTMGVGGGSSIDGGGCGLRTCDSVSATCGPIGDGCGAIIDCGQCIPPTTCGGGGMPNQCGGNSGCNPKTCLDIGAECGPMADGCGGLLNCGGCTAPASCGGGGIRSRCGQPGSNVGDGGTCSPITCATAGAQCGVIGDGCGGVLTCGSCDAGTCGGGGVPYQCGGVASCKPVGCPDAGTFCGKIGDGCGNILDCGNPCKAPNTCGGGGVANTCGGGSVCVPRDCADAGANCGQVGDGCGGLTVSCGMCGSGQLCGAGGIPNRCSTTQTSCVARSCADAGVNCGPINDGCGSIIMCGGCTDGGTCGGGGQANICGGQAACQPKTCAQQGANCGQVSNGCGGLTVSCGSCDGGEICGGSGFASVCGSVRPDAGGACLNLCQHQMMCGTGSTTLTGTVLAPTDSTLGYGNPDPISNALVYIPNAPVNPFDAGVTCDQCTAEVSGSPLVSTYSNTDGTFTLSNVPCGMGVQVPVVIQLGRWRREVLLNNLACCTNTPLTADQTRLPRKQAEGNPNDNIPLIAVVTGNADVIECVLPKIGIAPDQFSLPGGTGRVRFFHDNGAAFTGGAPDAGALYDNPNELKKYDMVIIDCVGGEHIEPAQRRKNLEAYANAGGRVFTSHFGYVWAYPNALDPNGNNITSPTSWTPTANWNVSQNDPPDQDAFIDISFPKGQTFADWVQIVGAQAASSTPAFPRINVINVRHDIDKVNAPAQQWVYGLASAPPSCTRASCNGTLGYACGSNVGDGCGGTRNCGSCSGGNTCGGAGTPGVCGKGGTCKPKTCADYGFQCGVFGNGCPGGTMDCGTCPGNQVCGATTPGKCDNLGPFIPLEYTFNTPTDAGTNACGRVLFSDFHVINAGNASASTWPGQCGNASPMSAQEKVFEYLLFDLSSCIAPDVPPPQMCTPRSCAQQNLQCGLAADGCGATLDCGMCDAGTCGGDGTPGVCGTPCTPKTCMQLGANCGQQGDGCGGLTVSCGTCMPPQSCGGGGTPNVCGGGACVPVCPPPGVNCGPQSNGCGGICDAGTCTPPQTCGGGGVQGQCGGGMMCNPLDCPTQGFDCGQQGNGCGGTINCGNCDGGMTCGGGGTPGVCGGGGSCTPKDCTAQGFNCGLQGNGCGGQIDCGNCDGGQICGLNGPGRCGAAGCTPLSCADQGIMCGPAGDGCGSLIQCGPCPTGETCGGGGTPGVCGKPPCTPQTCAGIGANCGLIGDGCGGTVDCGMCNPPQTCGGGGLPNVCGGIG